MIQASKKTPFKTAALAGVAMLAVSVATPATAKADATLAAALGGSALLGLILHSSQPVGGVAVQRAVVPAPTVVRGVVGRQVGPSVYSVVPPQAQPAYVSGPPAVIYSSVSPVVTQQRPQIQPRPVAYRMVATPIAVPQQMGAMPAYGQPMAAYQQPMTAHYQQPATAMPATYRAMPQPYQALPVPVHHPH